MHLVIYVISSDNNRQKMIGGLRNINIRKLTRTIGQLRSIEMCQ